MDDALRWYRSYLANRTQSFSVPSGISKPVKLTCSVPQGSRIGPQKFCAYTEDLRETIEVFDVSHHLYADDTQLQKHMRIANIPENIRNLENCVSHIGQWCSSRQLQLNADKTEVIWFGSRTNLKKLSKPDLRLQFGTSIVEPVNSVRDLGVHFDEELNMRIHIGKVSAACYYHLRRLRQLRRIISASTMQRLVSAFILSRIDYCNVLAGLPAVTLRPLQRVMHAAVRLVANLGWRDSVTEAMQTLHWLPIVFRVRYKLCVMMHASVGGNAPEYINNVLVPTSTLSGRSTLRSFTSGGYEVPRVRTEFGRRAFSVSGPVAWNQLPQELRRIVDISSFKRHLKAHLFQIAYET